MRYWFLILAALSSVSRAQTSDSAHGETNLQKLMQIQSGGSIPTSGNIFANGFMVPPEIINFQSLTNEFRSRVALKFKDMTQNFQTYEVRPGEMEFRDANGQQLVQIIFDRYIDDKKQNRTEWARYYDSTRKLILEEKIETSGTNLDATANEKRILFEGPADYDLTPQETTKSTLIGSGNDVLFRFLVKRSPKDANGVTETRYDVFVGLTQALSIRRAEFPTGVRIEYQFFSEKLSIAAGGSSISGSLASTSTFRIAVEKPLHYAADSVRFFVNDLEVFGTTSFLSKFNPVAYDGLMANIIIPSADLMVIPLFPATVRIANLAATGRFLDDLIKVKTLVDQAKTNPAQLTLVSSLVSQFINSMQDGTLAVTDNRPRK